ncbi:hypothetical protein GCM10027168_14590 [Streptomyces capparidis]
MRRVIELAGFALVLQGVGGLVDHLWGGFFVVDLLPFTEGLEVFANLVLAVLGGAVATAADRTRPW